MVVDLYIFYFLWHQTTMPGMKRDCGGAAALLGAFYAAVKQVNVELISDVSLMPQYMLQYC